MTIGLPGDPAFADRRRRMLRSDHAAACAAAGLAGPDQAACLAREAAFARLITAERIRPSLLAPLWRALGNAASRAGAAQAVRNGLEDAVDEQIAIQAALLNPADALRPVIASVRAAPGPAEPGQTPSFVSQAAKLACKTAFAASAWL